MSTTKQTIAYAIQEIEEKYSIELYTWEEYMKLKADYAALETAAREATNEYDKPPATFDGNKFRLAMLALAALLK